MAASVQEFHDAFAKERKQFCFANYLIYAAMMRLIKISILIQINKIFCLFLSALLSECYDRFFKTREKALSRIWQDFLRVSGRAWFLTY